MKKLFFLFLLLGTLHSSYAQNVDIDLLTRLNPNQPNSIVWRGATSSAYPLSVGVPAGIWFYATLKNNQSLRQQAYAVGGSVIISAALAEAVKLSVNRPRPYTTNPQLVHPYDASEAGYSMPSGHVSLAFANATALALTFKKWYVTVPAFAWATAVGYSRLYLGEHYPSDVLTAAIIGAGSAYAGRWLTQKYFQRKKEHKNKGGL
jgi:undecaprenyl-diphosphatase